MHRSLIILAGGASSRMKQSIGVEGLSAEEVREANTVSKALITYGKNQRPILDVLLSNAEKAGYEDIILIIGEQGEAFKSFYGNEMTGNSFGNMNLSYAVQHIPADRIKPFGTADAVTQALEQYPGLQNEVFTVCNCDNLYSVAALKTLRDIQAKNAFIAYDRDGLEFSTERISRFALALLDDDQNLIDIIEKPSEEKMEDYQNNDGTYRVSMNIFKFNGADMFTYLKNCPIHTIRKEKELPAAILNFTKEHPAQFQGILFKEHVPDLTSKEDIQIFKGYLNSL